MSIAINVEGGRGEGHMTELKEPGSGRQLEKEDDSPVQRIKMYL